MFKQQILAGEIADGMSFNEKVWAITARIPKGKVTTYGAIAQHLGTRGYRAIGMAMHRNPYAPTVPCHRVVGSNGALTGFAQGLPRKRQLLHEEGVALNNDRVDLTICMHALDR
jgi:methylated-DNA-[protein]-cysteine S-methyltransferase